MAGDMVKILSSVLANFDYPVVGTNCLQSLPWQYTGGETSPHSPLQVLSHGEGQTDAAQQPAYSAVLPQLPPPQWLD